MPRKRVWPDEDDALFDEMARLIVSGEVNPGLELDEQIQEAARQVAERAPGTGDLKNRRRRIREEFRRQAEYRVVRARAELSPAAFPGSDPAAMAHWRGRIQRDLEIRQRLVDELSKTRRWLRGGDSARSRTR